MSAEFLANRQFGAQNRGMFDMRSDGFASRWLLAIPVGIVVTYSVVVLWYVSTCPDLGFRVLLSDDSEALPAIKDDEESQLITPRADGRVGVLLQRSATPTSRYLPRRNDLLCEVNRKKTRTFLDFSMRMAELRDAPLPPGGGVGAGTEPTLMPRGHLPPIVEIDGKQRLVEIVFVRQGETPSFSYIAQQSLPTLDISLTFIWFVLQLAILFFGCIAFWNRPYDASVRLFCLMGTLSLGAFVGGFHWWVIAGNPWLNVPFLVCAGLLPAATLHFFLTFPRSKSLVTYWPVRALLYGMPGLLTLALVTVYLTAFWFNGAEADDQSLTTVVELLVWLRNGTLLSIGLAALYFVATVITLVVSFLDTRSVLERRQVRSILSAALISAVPMAYSLALIVQDRAGFAFGRARIPMFMVSLVFMLAYANGMIRHKLMLVDEIVGKGKLYYGVSAGVTTAFAVLIAFSAFAVHYVSESLSMLQRAMCFAVLMLVILILIWLRDQLQQTIDRRFFSEKYQLDKALQRMNRAAGRLADPESLARMLLGTCRDAIQTESAAIYFRQQPDQELRLAAADNYDEIEVTIDEPGVMSLGESATLRIPSSSREAMSPVQELIHRLRAELIYPLVAEDGIVGLVVLGHKQRGNFSAEDITFLKAVAQITTIALHSARTNQDLTRLNDELQAKVDRIAEQQRQLMILKAELDNSADQAPPPAALPGSDLDLGELKGRGEAIQAVLQTVSKVAPSDATVLIRGESGTGKELLARTLHRNSGRREGPLVSVHCAALSESLLESELFGHAKGAFTGAHQDKIGRFEAAHGGTLFLDEIGDISAETQVKLLRVLQERCFEPVGSSRTIHTDVRLVTATNRNLEQLIARNAFREDLFYRLNVIQLNLPPLRERQDDLVELVFHFIHRASERMGKTIRRIEPEALAVLERYGWPGNIRELENTIERAVVLAEGTTITLRDLPVELLAPAATLVLSSSSPAPPMTVSDSAPRMDTFAEREMLAAALRSTGGNKAEAARQLGIPRSTFYSKLKKHQLA